MRKENYQKPKVELHLIPTGQNVLLNLSLDIWDIEDFEGLEDIDF